MSAKRNAAAEAANQTRFDVPEAVVIGDGWAALATVGFLVQELRSRSLEAGKPAERGIVWVAGTGARMLSALPGMEAGPGVELWARLARGFGIDPGEAASGSFLREFRNKAFREPLWTKAPTPETRQEVIHEELWGPERRLVPRRETRFSLALNEIEARIRALLTGEGEEGAPFRGLIRRVEGLPVASFRVEEGQVRGVTLASGEEIASSRILFADRWGDLPATTGLPKNLSFIRRRDPASVFQATFVHKAPIGVGVTEGFFGLIQKEAGESMDRHVWGHFSADGLQSYWTLCLTGEEVEDNHQIAKKLRRMKNALDKMFTGSAWLPEDRPEFMMNVSSERVRFQEAVLFAEGEELTAPVPLAGADGIQFLTDGYGPAAALLQVSAALGLPASVEPAGAESPVTGSEGTDPQAEGVHPEGPTAP